jgi:hypothetical protein
MTVSVIDRVQRRAADYGREYFLQADFNELIHFAAVACVISLALVNDTGRDYVQLRPLLLVLVRDV